ncbi:heterokaryon incompatibility, partial [Hyaloscypha finlandica]
RYAPLSYVWGHAVQVKLGGSDEMSLQVKDSLSKFKLPQTISDAIHLTRLLAIKFLWVDVLCICQGQTDFDLRDRQDQLNNMGNIYHQASLTIIAA